MKFFNPKKLAINLLISFLATTYSFRAYFYGYLLGDEYDTRLMISQHEHWFRLFFKNGIFKDTLYFYPTQDALGFTDAFLIPSAIYTPLRFFGLGILEAWSLASFLTLFLGLLGWLFLIELLVENKFLRITLFINLTLLPGWVAQFEYFPNAIGYTFISWLLLVFLKTINSTSKKTFIINLNVLTLVLLSLALTSWYPAAFTIIIVAFSLISLYKKYKKLEFNTQNNIQFFITLSTLLAANLALILTWISIYIPKLKETETLRSWREVLFHSVSFKDLLNPLELNNGVIFLLFKNGNINILEERNLGLPIFLTLITTVLIVLIVFNLKTWKQNYLKFYNYKIFFFNILIPSLLISFIFIKLTDNFSIYKIFWEVIPGLSSIRYPYRFTFVLGFVLWIFIFMTIDIYLKQNKKPIVKNIIFILLTLTALDNLKPLYSFWGPEDYLPSTLYKQKEFIQNSCDYFILDRPGGWWDDATKSIALSAITGISTVNGQSSAYPPGYPIKPQLYEGDITEMLEWAQFGTSDKTGCFVSDSFEPILSSGGPARVETYDGFSPKESNQSSFWNWSTSDSSILLISLPKNKDFYTLQMEIKSAPCITNRTVVFNDFEKGKVFETQISFKGTEIEFTIPRNKYGLIKIELNTDEEYCLVEGDPRKLFYEIKNYKLN